MLPPPQTGRVGIYFGPEVAQHYQRLSMAGIFESDAGFSAVFGAKIFVLGEFSKPDKLRAVEGLAIDFASALHADEAIRAIIVDGATCARLDG